ncbi:hypothetical protein BIW11_11286 [Tropilaelaps mercedesae]|uniref:Uncharacterized protein n=1 Tax=Tropilaelaps mercedesae TaxID=418985 RepID=A0A1V9XBZ8_9ACAR|nr:hypothetical protein BIW11_11286 [Tropilaelaps mercedesae]
MPSTQVGSIVILVATFVLAFPVLGEKLDAAFLSGALLHRLEKTSSSGTTAYTDNRAPNLHVSTNKRATDDSSDLLIDLLDKLATHNRVLRPQTKLSQRLLKSRTNPGEDKPDWASGTVWPTSEEETIRTEGSG